LPEKYNDIMKILYNKEIRVYLPIQELNLLLEPIRKPGEEVIEQDEINENSIKSESVTESSDEEIENSEEEESENE